MEKALGLMKQGQKQEALSRLKQVVAENPDDAEAAVVLAQSLVSEGQLRRAETILYEQIARHPEHGKANLVLAELLRIGKRYDEAERYYGHALRLLPEDAAVAYNLGLMRQLANEPQAAGEAYEEACRRAPGFAPAAHNLAAIRLAEGGFDAAEQGFARVLEIDPKHLNARYNLGRIAELRGQSAVAETRYVEVLRANPNHADVLHALGALLLRQNRNLDWAEKCFKAYIRQQPRSGLAYHELGVLLASQARLAEAIPCLEAAVEFSAIAASASAREDLANVLVRSGRLADAIARLDGVVAIWPEHGNALLALIRLKLAACSWDRLPALCARLAALPEQALPDRPTPYPALAIPGLEGEAVFRIATRNAARVVKQAQQTGADGKKPRRRSGRTIEKQLRIGYLYSDLDDLIVSEGLAAVLAHHDRERFELYAYSFNAADANESCGRVAAAVEAYRFVGRSSAAEVADVIRADKLDVLVDLNGWISLHHAPVLAARPAPVVVSGWGHPASTGDGRLADYLLADAITVPQTAAEPFAEQVLRLPGCFRPAAQPALALPDISRGAAGLPEEAIVLCSFASPHQLNPEVFDLWCGALRELPVAVLWLADPGDAVKRALVEEARKRYVPENRLVFAPRVTRAAHLARLRLADVALDTFPLCAVQSAVDALSVGVSVVTLIGERFAGRTVASLLHAAGREELVAQSRDDYLDVVRTLADAPKRLGETSALFDVAGFTRGFEAVLRDVSCAKSGGS